MSKLRDILDRYTGQVKLNGSIDRDQAEAAIKQLVRDEKREELQDILTDMRGNEEAGYSLSKGWFIKRINDRLEEL